MGLKAYERLLAVLLLLCFAAVVVCLVATIRGDDDTLNVATWPAFAFGLLAVVTDSAYNRAWAAGWANRVTDEIRQADARFSNKEDTHVS